MKKHLFLLPICFLLCLSGCATQSYRDDRTASEVLSEVERAVSSDATFHRAEEDYLSASAFEEDVERLRQQVTDWAVALSDRSDSYPDEIAVFHVGDRLDDRVQDVAEAVRRHGESLRLRLGDYFRMYAPTQLPKLENVSVKVCGRYVLLTVLDEQQTQAAQKAFEKALQ